MYMPVAEHIQKEVYANGPCIEAVSRPATRFQYKFNSTLLEKVGGYLGSSVYF